MTMLSRNRDDIGAFYHCLKGDEELVRVYNNKYKYREICEYRIYIPKPRLGCKCRIRKSSNLHKRMNPFFLTLGFSLAT